MAADPPAATIDAAEVDTLVRAACAAAVPYPSQTASSPQKLDAASAAIAEGVLKRLAAGGGVVVAAAGAAGGAATAAAPATARGSSARFKFVVSVHLSQALGAGLHVAAAHRLDPRTDGRVVVSWQGAAEVGGSGGGTAGGGGDANGSAPNAPPPPPVVLDALVTVFYVAI
jgi:hypothetical protein